jgi:hypothetical protein
LCTMSHHPYRVPLPPPRMIDAQFNLNSTRPLLFALLKFSHRFSSKQILHLVSGDVERAAVKSDKCILRKPFRSEKEVLVLTLEHFRRALVIILGTMGALLRHEYLSDRAST